MKKNNMGQGSRIASARAHWTPHGIEKATSQRSLHTHLSVAPINLVNRRRFVGSPPPPETDSWQAVPDWVTWLALVMGLSIVALLLSAIVYLLG